MAGFEVSTYGRFWVSTEAESEEGVEDAWRAEIERRMAELDSGTVKTIPWEELRARLFRR